MNDQAGRLTIDDLRRARESKPLRELPKLVAGAVGFVWRASRRGAIVLTSVSVIQGVLGVALLAAGAHLLSRTQRLDESGDLSSIGWPLVLFVGALVTQSLVGALAWSNRLVLGENTSRLAQRVVGGAARRAPLLSYEDPVFHDQLIRALANSASRPLQVTTAVATLASSVFVSVGLFAALVWLQPLVLLVLAGGVIPLWLATRRMTRIGYEFTLAETAEDRRRSYFLFLMTSKDTAQEQRAYQWGGHVDDQYAGLWDSRIARVVRYVRRRTLMSSIAALANGVIVASVVLLLAWTVADGRSGLASAGAAGAAVLLLGSRLNAIMGSIGTLYECALFLADVDTFLAEFPDDQADDAQSSEPAVPASAGELRAERVTFRYPSGVHPALRDVSLHVRSGELVALVGANGSGKTTLAKLLAGLLPPSAGEVTWNGSAVRSGDPIWHAQVAVVFQDHLRFFLPLRDNVAFGRTTTPPTDDAVSAALEKAGLGSLVNRLPQGLHTMLGPQFHGGTDLSGGQWQRVALARAFFRDAGVVILDEPSSALDPDAEAALFDTVHELCAGRAVIVISHRFSTVTRADRIYVLGDGGMIESGSHAELMARDGEYARMFRLQASRFEVPDGQVS